MTSEAASALPLASAAIVEDKNTQPIKNGGGTCDVEHALWNAWLSQRLHGIAQCFGHGRRRPLYTARYCHCCLQNLLNYTAGLNEFLTAYTVQRLCFILHRYGSLYIARNFRRIHFLLLLSYRIHHDARTHWNLRQAGPAKALWRCVDELSLCATARRASVHASKTAKVTAKNSLSFTGLFRDMAVGECDVQQVQ